MGHTRSLVLAALGSLLLAAGCLSDTPDDFGWGAKDLPNPEGWMESGPFLCQDFDVLWETSKNQALKNGFFLDDDSTTYKHRRIVTRWKMDLATAKYSGKRERRFVEFVAEKEMKDGWRVRVATVVQRNADMDNPLNPTTAEWRDAAPNIEDAERVAYLIEAQFRDFGASRELEGK